MADLKPPRLVGGERETVLALIQYQRNSFVRKVSGVNDEDAKRSLVDSGTSLLWLTNHLARAESLWILQRFAGHPIEVPEDDNLTNESIELAIDSYRHTWQVVDPVISAASSLNEVCSDVGDESPVNLRWVLMHLLEEIARHAGHADVLREMIDGTAGR